MTQRLCHPRPASQRGVALMLVMGAVAIVFVIAMNVLSGLPATAQAAKNLVNRDAAVYLAESGLVEGLARLANPPSGEWTGVTGRTIVGMSGTYDVAITDQGDGVYQITASGHAVSGGGGSITHQLTMTVRVTTGGGGNVYTMKHGALFGVGGFIPANARVRGDVFVPGNVFNFGRVDGELSATGSVLDFGRTDSIEARAEDVEVPDVDADLYLNYTDNGSSQAAETVTSNAASNYSGKYTPDTDGNALGVVVVEGDMTLSDDVTFDGGILIVRGDLNLNGHRLRVDGPADSTQVALIVEGNTEFSRRNSELEVDGGVAYLGGSIVSGWTATNSKLDARQGLIVKQGMPLAFNGDIDVRWDNNGGAGTDVNFFGEGGSSGGSGGGSRTVTPLNYSVNPGS